MEKQHYYAWVQNGDGASMTIGHASNIRELETQARHQYGDGWTVHIMRVEINGESTEVKKFILNGHGGRRGGAGAKPKNK